MRHVVYCPYANVREQEQDVPEDLEALIQIPLLSSLTNDELASVRPILKPVKFGAGEIIFRQGEPGDSIYFILRGSVKFTIKHDTGTPDSFEECGPGRFFGEVAVFTQYGQRTATAEVTTELEGYTLRRDQLIAFLHKHPEAALHLL